MKILRLLGLSIIIFAVLVGNAVWAQAYSIEAGSYAFASDGFNISVDSATGQTQSPAAAVGRIEIPTDITAQGTGTATAVQNLGGIAILKFESTSTTITIDPQTGLGNVSSTVTLTEPPEAAAGPLPSDFPFVQGSQAVFEFSFVTEDDETLHIMQTKLSTPDGTPLAAIVGLGIMKRQESASAQ